MEEEEEEELLSTHRRKNKATEKELHHMSEKLSRRLQDLDQVGGCGCGRGRGWDWATV